MNRDETKKAIEVMQAYVDDKEVESRNVSGSSSWGSTFTTWNWSRFEYRIKPKPREFWLYPFDEGLKVAESRQKAEDYKCEQVGGYLGVIKVREVL